MAMTKKNRDELNTWLLTHEKNFHQANRKFFGVPGAIVERDMGPELTWEEPADRTMGLYLMLVDVHEMLTDVMQKLVEKDAK